VNPTLRCTHCGRKIPRDEWARVRLTKTDTIEGIEVVCALHTDEEIAGN
jgi:ribosomal protein S26